MKLIAFAVGLVLLILLGLQSFAPIVGYEEGFLGDWFFVVLGVALLPLGAVMVVRRQRMKREARGK